MIRRGAGNGGERLVVLIQFLKNLIRYAFLHFLFGLSNVTRSVLCIGYNFVTRFKNSKP